MIAFFILHVGFSLIIFICVFLYANVTAVAETDLCKDWNFVKYKFKNRLKQDYILKKDSEFILIRLMFLDNCFIKNSIQVEPSLENGSFTKLKLSGRTDLKPFGFMVFLLLTFVFYIGAVYMYLVIKKARERSHKEMQFVANLSFGI